MLSRLSAGASCQLCREPFGRLEDLRAPFAIPCGHTFCVGCLNNDESHCLICGALFDRQTYFRLCSLVANIERHQPIPLDAEEKASRLRDDIAGIGDATPLNRMRQIYDACHDFLDSQPRNRFQDLAIHANLLGRLILSKETVQSQVACMDTMVENLHRVTAQNRDLEERLMDLEQGHSAERRYMLDHVDGILKTNPDYNLLTDEVLRLQGEMNDLRQAVHKAKEHCETHCMLPVPPQVESRTPRIRVHPPSRSPSPMTPVAPAPRANETETPYSLSPLTMSAIRDDFSGQLAPQPFDPDMFIPDLRLSHAPSDNSSSPGSNSYLDGYLVEDDSADYAPSEHASEAAFYDSDDTYWSMEDDGIRSQPASPEIRNTWESGTPPTPAVEPSALDQDARTESFSDAEACSVLSRSILSLPLLHTPDGWRAAQNHAEDPVFGVTTPTIVAPVSSARLLPEHFFSSVANLSTLINEPTRDISRSSNPTAHILTRVADIVSNTFRPRNAATATATANQTRLADMRVRLIEVVACIFVHLMSDRQTQAAALYTANHLSAQTASFLDAPDEAPAAYFTPLNPDPSSPAATPTPDVLPDLISLD